MAEIFGDDERSTFFNDSELQHEIGKNSHRNLYNYFDEYLPAHQNRWENPREGTFLMIPSKGDLVQGHRTLKLAKVF